MKSIVISLVLLSGMFMISCASDNNVNNVQSIPTLISEGFINDSEYEIVCIGFPKPGLTGMQKDESSKRAALLNAYFYSKNRFDDTVNPDRDGTVAKMTVFEDRAEVKYIIKKTGLKRRIKK